MAGEVLAGRGGDEKRGPRSTIERPYSGYYARVNGGDGVGKTTLIKRAEAYAQAHDLPLITVREPGGTPTGNSIRDILLHDRSVHLSPEAEVALFSADRRITCDTVSLPWLQQNGIVLGDRGFEATVAYQGAGGEIDIEKVIAVSEVIMPRWYIYPDAMINLYISEEERIRRLYSSLAATGEKADKIEQRAAEYHARVAKIQHYIAERFGGIMINAECSPDEVFEQAKPYLFGPFLAA